MPMSRPRQSGFTLIELIIFIVVLGVGMAGILIVSTTVVKSSADPMVSKQAVAAAESLLEEILLKDYANPATGGYTGSTRALFDDVSDYAGYTTTTGVVDSQGNATAGLSGYNYSPAVSVVAATGTEFPGGIAGKKITVSVTGPLGTIALVGYRGNY
jgi:MSHA pilin protein MshD